MMPTQLEIFVKEFFHISSSAFMFLHFHSSDPFLIHFAANVYAVDLLH